jgi:hypothetical protein
MCQPHLLPYPPPPLNSTYHLPSPPGTRLTTTRYFHSPLLHLSSTHTSTPYFSPLSSFPHHLSDFSPYTSPSHPHSPLVTCHLSPHSLHVIFHLSLSLTLLHLLIPSPLDTCPHVILYVTIVPLLKPVLTSHLPRWISGKTGLILQKRKRFVSEIG